MDKSNLLRGMELAVVTMNLGEHSEFVLSGNVAFDTQGYTSLPGYVDVAPNNSNVIVKMELMEINGKRREIPQDPSCFSLLCGRNSHGWAS